MLAINRSRGWGLVSGTELTHATDTAHYFTYYANYGDGEERAVPMSVVGDKQAATHREGGVVAATKCLAESSHQMVGGIICKGTHLEGALVFAKLFT